MSFFLCFGASQLAPLLLLLLLPPPLTSFPRSHTEDSSDLQSALLHLHADPAIPQDHPDARTRWLQDPGPAEEREAQEEPEGRSWEEGWEPLLRAQRGELTVQPLSPFPGGHSAEGLHYQEGGEGEEGWRRNEALTSMAGGLQAAGREKGGFVFRFGRNQWTDGGWRRSEEEDEEDEEGG